MWNGPVSKVFVVEIAIGRCSHKSSLLGRSFTARHDEIRDTDLLIVIRRHHIIPPVIDISMIYRADRHAKRPPIHT